MSRHPALIPRRDVEAFDDPHGFVALSTEPWLTLAHPILARAAGRVVEIVYRASLWDDPARPVFRFETADGRLIDRIAAGPVASAGRWIGRVPAGTVRVDISPTNKTGRFSFAVESVRHRGLVDLLALGCRQNPRSTRSAVLTRMIGWAAESDVNLAWAVGATRLGDYRSWLKRRHRTIDLPGLDKPRFDWRRAPSVTVAIDLANGADSLSMTLESLGAQIFSDWRAVIFGALPPETRLDPRIMQADPRDPLAASSGLLMTLAPGDVLKPHALACLIEAAHRAPDRDLFYGDEEVTGLHGITPVFKPGWSLRLYRQKPFLGRAVALRTPLAGWTDGEVAAFVANAVLPDRVAPRAIPIRRVLLRTPSSIVRPAPRPLSITARPDATAAIIIPTKDQARLLRRALDSIRRFSDPKRTRIIILDNGSIEDETLRLFAEMRADPAVTVIARPGPFNFSAMCNDGAAASAADVLVFLNDDTEVLHEGWLDRLAAWAILPDVGAVGAKLTYPDGRLQHIGVLLGMGDSAGHFGALAAADDPGWHGRNAVVHEVSAVTGACLAVSRAKFEAVGGFDAVNLPIELSDIDLCLALAARGWVCLVDPLVHLTHAESASRGTATFRRLDVYETQRAYFAAKWRAILRDDPTFHPGLSLYARGEALG